MTETTPTNETWKFPENPWPATLAVMIASFIFILDSTIANVARPHMAGTFSSSDEETLWILTSYMVASGIILPSVNWFSGVFGRKKFFISCILIFTGASFLCGLAHSLGQMIVFRILQGLGGGAIMPIAQAVLLENFPPEKRRLSMSIFAVGIILAPVIGPVLGGWITDNYSWHWIFYINIPLGLLAAYMSNKHIEDPPFARKKEGQKIDFWGFAFLISWLVSLQIVLDKGQNADWFNAPWICWMSALSVFSMIAFVVSQIVNKKSLLDLSVFKDRNFVFGTIMLMMVMGVLYASIAIMPLFLQVLLRYTAFLSGCSMIPRDIGSISAIIATGIFIKKTDDRVLIAIGLMLLGSGGLVFGNTNLQISMMNVFIPNFIFGLGMGFCMIPISTLSVCTLDNTKMTNATGIQSLLKNISGAIGMSAVATMISRHGQMHQQVMVGHLTPLNPVFQAKAHAMTGAFAQYSALPVAAQKANFLMYSELLKQCYLCAFMDAFRIVGMLCFLIIPIILLMKPHVKKEGEELDMSAVH